MTTEADDHEVEQAKIQVILCQAHVLEAAGALNLARAAEMLATLRLDLARKYAAGLPAWALDAIADGLASDLDTVDEELPDFTGSEPEAPSTDGPGALKDALSDLVTRSVITADQALDWWQAWKKGG